MKGLMPYPPNTQSPEEPAGCALKVEEGKQAQSRTPAPWGFVALWVATLGCLGLLVLT